MLFKIASIQFAKLVAILVSTFLLTFLVFAVPALASPSGSHSLEQEINVTDTIATFNSVVPSPIDNSLGIIRWDPSKYSQFSHARLEILGITDSSANQITAALFDTSGNIVPQSKVTIGNANRITTLDGCPECNEHLDTIYTSEVLDAQGNPVIAYISQNIGSEFGTGDGDLKLVHCGNADCTAGNFVVDVDGCTTCKNNIDVGKHSSILLNSLGNPVISYEDESGGYLRVVVCGNSNCSSGNVYSLVDNGCAIVGAGCHGVGTYSSMQLDSVGKPVVTYFDATSDDLRVVHCGDTTCSSNNVYKVLDGCATCTTAGQSKSSSTGQYSSLVLDSSGFPMVSYRDGAPNHDLKFLHCKDVNCNSVIYKKIDNGTSTTDSSGIYTSMQLDAAGFPVISFARGAFTGGDLDLKLVHCNDANCSSFSDVTLDGRDQSTNCASGIGTNCDVGDVGWYNKLELDQNGNPIIAYRSQVSGDLKVIHCNDSRCLGNNESVVRVDGCPGCNEDGNNSQNGAGGYISMQIDILGNPVISYRQIGPNGGFNNLKMVHCGNVDCNPVGAGQINPTKYQLSFSSEFNPSLISNSGPRDFTLRAWTANGAGYIKSAKLLLTQNSNTPITNTETQLEMGNNETTTSLAYTPLLGEKIVGYDASTYDPTPTISFEATVKADPGSGNSIVPKTVVATAGVATGINWSRVNNTTSSDDLYAYSASKTQDFLALSHFGFNIPEGSVITGVMVDREGKGANIKTTNRQYRMSLSKDGGSSIAGLEKVHLDLPYITDDVVSIGGSNDLWGTTFSGQEINSPNFSVLLRSDNTMGTRIGFDQVKVTIFYEDKVASVVSAALYSTDDQLVAGSEISTNSTSWVRLRTSAINLVSGKNYLAKIKTSGGIGSIANAKLVFDQSGAEIAKLSMSKLLVNSPVSDNHSSFFGMNDLENYDEENYSGYKINKYLDTTARNSDSGGQLRLFDITQNAPLSSSQLSISSSSLTRFTSNLITESILPGSLLDLQSQSEGGSMSTISAVSLMLNLAK